jgi:dihydroxyacid dehydratase/phosphogluconate dehydratase
VVVLRTRGPAGAPGMPEQLKLSGAIMGESDGKSN